ncbi:5-oxoprolinase subunit PxpA [Sphingobacterium gobiense]|uniref:5-oxoprolinase subunit A n=1 Tax=Sphingobacterium gobiense TaxID=1382456 RepID=A0A2S9JV03_9SPHI|nr:5-oxoprolinase subunit PxpA [Sphingobacterium gobiense]PRD57105.1 LamB/YcsF family protein [Sphingobacterium gobiense]
MASSKMIDLNCDLGESFGSWRMGNDEAILPFVTSVNIACGFHAGDPSTMMKTVALAASHDVHIGAHPGFKDMEGFGRRQMALTPMEVYDLMLYQIGALYACTKAQGVLLHHVKPHGALYNMAAQDNNLAKAIADAVYAFDPNLVLYGLSGSALIAEGEQRGLTVYSEVFADRTYQADGMLIPRTMVNAVITDYDRAFAQALLMATEGKVITADGVNIPIKADTICMHGDNESAIAIAQKVHHALNLSRTP